MFVIASNITTRDAGVKRAFKQAAATGWKPVGEPADLLVRLAEDCVAGHADAVEVNTQQHYDEPEAMRFAVSAVQKAVDVPLCLSSDNAAAIEAGLAVCKKPPLVNYLSIDRDRLEKVLPMAARFHASLILLVSDPAGPTDAMEMLQKTAILVGAANSAGIPNERIFVDPGLIHVTNDLGQRHMAEIIEFLRELPRAVDPPVRTTCWLSSSSTGAPARRRSIIEASLLCTLAGAGLDSVFMDVLRPENRRAVRLTRIFSNELVYSDSDLEV